jgi:hypothetical protein
MLGVPIEGPTNVFCDNEVVCKNTTKPESVLKKEGASQYCLSSESQSSATGRKTHEFVGPVYQNDGSTKEGELVRQLYV